MKATDSPGIHAPVWLIWLPAVAVTALQLTVPNVIAFGAGELRGPEGVGDFGLHVMAYLVICFAWWRVFRTAPDARLARWAAPLAVVTAVAVGAVDEALQAIPVLNRTCCWRDFLADIIGALLAATIAFEAARIGRNKSKAA